MRSLLRVYLPALLLVQNYGPTSDRPFKPPSISTYAYSYNSGLLKSKLSLSVSRKPAVVQCNRPGVSVGVSPPFTVHAVLATTVAYDGGAARFSSSSSAGMCLYLLEDVLRGV